VKALAVYDDGSGPALYAGGQFASAGGVVVNNVARWDGEGFTALAGGLKQSPLFGGLPEVRALTVYDDGSGPALYAGGYFSLAGGLAVRNVARWDGSSWTALVSGMPNGLNALAVLDGPERAWPALVAGGTANIVDSFIGAWQGCRDRTPPVLSCPTIVTVSDPTTGPPGEIVAFTVTASDDHDASPTLVCEPPSGSFFPPGITIVQCKASDDARNQSSCSFPVNVMRK
jgi:hypothetical protein